MKATTIIVFVLLVSVSMTQYYRSKPLERNLEVTPGLLAEECSVIHNQIRQLENMISALKASSIR